MAWHRKTVLKYVSLAVGCLCTVAGGSIAAINAYSSDLRDTFNLTQSQVSLIMAMGNLGYSTVIAPGMFLERFGAVWTSVLGLVLGCSSNFGVAFGIKYNTWFTHNFWAILVLTLFLGFGSSFLFTNALVTNTLNFTIMRRGRVVGLLSAFFWAGSSIFSAIYVGVYNTDPSERGDLQGYFFMGATCFAVVSILSLIFTRQYPITHDVETYIKQYEDEETKLVDKKIEEAELLATGSHKTTAKETKDSEREMERSVHVLELSTHTQRTIMSRYLPNLSYGDLSFLELTLNVDFHLIFWPCVLCQAIQFTVIFNMSTYFESFDMMDQIGFVTVGGPMVGSLSKFAGGLMSDLTLLKLPRVWLITITNLCQAAVLTLCVFAADVPAITIVLAVVHYIAVGTQMSVVPALVGDLYGVKHFGRNWGAVSFVNAAAASIFQVMMGVLYDKETLPGDTVCHGNHCFQTTFIVFSACALLSVGLDFALFRRHWDKYKRHWRDAGQTDDTASLVGCKSTQTTETHT